MFPLSITSKELAFGKDFILGGLRKKNRKTERGKYVSHLNILEIALGRGQGLQPYEKLGQQ